MILLREARENDADAIERLANIPGFFNLPNDVELLKERIRHSLNSLKAPEQFEKSSKFMFVAEDLNTHEVLGTSMIAAQHGTESSPHFFFKVGQEKKFSSTINTGFIHGTLELGLVTNGPSEIGGLVVSSEVRNHPSRVGRQISFVRFLYLATHRKRFKDKVISELLPPLNKKGQSPLWEAIGRRFTNMDYWEADLLCSKDKEFVLSLFPSGKIYSAFLTAEARNAIGRVGKDTEPVAHLLKRIGFEYHNEVDPFDGGPHLWADVEKIAPVSGLKHLTLSTGALGGDNSILSGLIAAESQKPGQFRAISVSGEISGSEFVIQLNSEIQSGLDAAGIKLGSSISFIPFY